MGQRLQQGHRDPRPAPNTGRWSRRAGTHQVRGLASRTGLADWPGGLAWRTGLADCRQAAFGGRPAPGDLASEAFPCRHPAEGQPKTRHTAEGRTNDVLRRRPCELSAYGLATVQIWNATASRAVLLRAQLPTAATLLLAPGCRLIDPAACHTTGPIQPESSRSPPLVHGTELMGARQERGPVRRASSARRAVIGAPHRSEPHTSSTRSSQPNPTVSATTVRVEPSTNTKNG
jgi:hypothetical protein